MGRGKIIIALCLIVGIPALLYLYSTHSSSSKPTVTTEQTPVAAQTTFTPAVQEDLSLFKTVATWVPTATWTSPAVANTVTSYGKISGYEIHATITSQKPMYGGFEDKTILATMGFVLDNAISAGGPLGDEWGYKKVVGNQLQVLVLSFQRDPGEFLTQRPMQSLSCPCKITLSTFLSTPFTPAQ